MKKALTFIGNVLSEILKLILNFLLFVSGLMGIAGLIYLLTIFLIRLLQ